jgi:hypothetical protein
MKKLFEKAEKSVESDENFRFGKKNLKILFCPLHESILVYATILNLWPGRLLLLKFVDFDKLINF